MTVAVKPVSVALALCWHAGSRLTRLGTSLMRTAAQHGHVPAITDEDAARMAPETADEAKSRMRGDFQDWHEGVRTHMRREGHDPDALVTRHTRQWLADQQANPTWIPAPEVQQWMLDRWPVWEHIVATDITLHGRTSAGFGVALKMGRWRPLILPGMDIGRRDGVIDAKDMTPAHFRIVTRWQWRDDDFPEWQWDPQNTKRSKANRMAAVEDTENEQWRPATWAELDED